MKKTIYIIAAAAIAAVSCNEKLDNLSPSPVKAKMTISAIAEQPAAENAVKSALGSGDAVLWSEGDQIALFNAAGGSKTTYTLTYGAGTGTGEFEGDEIIADNVIGVYPSSCVDESALLESGSVNVTIPAVQQYAENSFPTNANLSVAVGNGSLEFKNVMGVFELQLYASSKRSIKQIQIAAAENLAGKAKLSVDTDGIPSLEFISDTTKVITISFSSAIQVSTDQENPTRIYAVLPVGALAKGVTVSMMNNNADPIYALKRATKANTIKRSTIKEMPAFEISPIVTRSNLANTIILEPSQAVNIYPLQPVTGELMGHFERMVNTFLSSAVTGSSASCTLNNYTNGAYAKVTASANEGCLGYAFRDYDGQIFWSYMIWVTDKPEDITLSDGTVIMDRNLGASATSPDDIVSRASETYGKPYQWGRKDPAINVTDNIVAATTETGTVDYVIKNPTKFIATADGTTYSGDWNWTGDDTLWGATKTIYDPCPAGYKVPNGTGATALWTACDFAANAGTYDSANRGYYFSVTGEGEDPIWLPLGTYYSNAGTAYAGGYYWNYNSVTMTGGAHYSRLFSFSSTKLANSSNSPRGYACLIRCVKIQ